MTAPRSSMFFPYSLLLLITRGRPPMKRDTAKVWHDDDFSGHTSKPLARKNRCVLLRGCEVEFLSGAYQRREDITSIFPVVASASPGENVFSGAGKAKEWSAS